RRSALGAEATPRSRAQRHVEAAGSERLLELGVAAKAGDLDFEPLLFKNLGLDSHFGRAEGKRIGNRLAETDLVERERRAGGPQRKRCEEAYQRAPPQHVVHRLSLTPRLYRGRAAARHRNGGTPAPLSHPAVRDIRSPLGCSCIWTCRSAPHAPCPRGGGARLLSAAPPDSRSA